MKENKYQNILTREILEDRYIIQDRSLRQIAREFQCGANAVLRYMNKYNIPTRNCGGSVGKYNFDMTNKKYGKLTVLKLACKKSRYNKWLCKCDCGKLCEIRSGQLLNNINISCGCNNQSYNTITTIGNNKQSGYHDIPNWFWIRLQRNAYLRNIIFDNNITPKILEDIYIKQNKKCVLSGLDIHFPNSYTDIVDIISVDRIDAKLGYSLNNIQLVHKNINLIKQTMSNDDFYNLCILVTNPLIYDSDHLTDSLYMYPTFYKTYHSSAKRRHLLFNIDEEYILKQFIKQNGQCAITGQLLILPQNYQEYKSYTWTASLDRIDNNLGYIKDNIQWVHKLVNLSRSSLSIDRYRFLCFSVVNYYRNNIYV
jgi:hypothetical protein